MYYKNIKNLINYKKNQINKPYLKYFKKSIRILKN